MRYRVMNSILRSVIFLFVFMSCALADPADSIVKIIAGNQAGTGFVWQGQGEQKFIVTSLHTLAGASKIFYNRASSATQLNVVHTDEESDLALLIPVNGSLDLPSLQLTSAQPVPNTQYVIWGFPAGVKIIQGDSIEFSLGPQLVSLQSLLPNNILTDITASGYPKASLNILRVSSGITPGHSGAPILVKGTDQVIGIGAGGLSMLGFRRVNWAVPAQTYLEKVSVADSPVVDVTDLQSTNEAKYKFSVASAVNSGDGTSEATLDAQEPLAVKTTASQYYRIYQVPLSDLLDSFSATDDSGFLSEEYLAEIWDDAADLDYDLDQAQIDVYQNTETGAMIYLPAGTELTSRGDLLIASTAGNRVQMYVQIVETNSYDQAQTAKDRFVAQIESEYGTDWYTDEESDQTPYHDSEFGLWMQWIQRFQADNPEADAESEYTLSLTIDYDDLENYADFLGVSVLGQNFSEYRHEDDVLLHQMDVCGVLAGFVPR